MSPLHTPALSTPLLPSKCRGGLLGSTKYCTRSPPIIVGQAGHCNPVVYHELLAAGPDEDQKNFFIERAPITTNRETCCGSVFQLLAIYKGIPHICSVGYIKSFAGRPQPTYYQSNSHNTVED